MDRFDFPNKLFVDSESPFFHTCVCQMDHFLTVPSATECVDTSSGLPFRFLDKTYAAKHIPTPLHPVSGTNKKKRLCDVHLLPSP